MDESMPLIQNMFDGSCKRRISYNEVEKYKSMCLLISLSIGNVRACMDLPLEFRGSQIDLETSWSA